MGNTSPVGRKVTLSDIAAGCDVSRATVSLVLRGSPLVNKHTRARVEEELRRQGYVYNRAAANLRRRTSSSIALVLNDLANPFFAEFAAGVDEVLGNAGYVTLLGSTSESTEREQAVLGSLMEHGPAGIILSPAEGSDATQLLAAVGSPTGQTRTQALSAGGQQEILHGRKDRPAQQEFRRRRKVLLREQNRREFTSPIVQLIRCAVGAGTSAVVIVGRSAHPIDGLDHLQRAGRRLGHHGPLFGRPQHDEAPRLRVGP